MAITAEPLLDEEEGAPSADTVAAIAGAARRGSCLSRSQPLAIERARLCCRLRDFCAFAARTGREPLPAQPETVATSPTSNGGRRPATIAQGRGGCRLPPPRLTTRRRRRMTWCHCGQPPKGGAAAENGARARRAAHGDPGHSGRSARAPRSRAAADRLGGGPAPQRARRA
jgi:hypothetical protein